MRERETVNADNRAYSKKEKTITIDARHFVEHYREVARFETLCKQCGGYGKRWGCPPVSDEWQKRLLQYSHATLMATVMTPLVQQQPLSRAFVLMRDEIDRMNREAIAMEKATDGMACGFAGKCYYCGKQECSRLQGEPCRHPELVRPSLEALGFNLQSTARDFLDIDLAWSPDGKTLPPYLTVLTAVFHNSGKNKRQ